VPRRKKKQFTATKEVKALAREQVGAPKAVRVIVPKEQRKPKYPPKLEEQ
jgi:hypothetical protein